MNNSQFTSHNMRSPVTSSSTSSSSSSSSSSSNVNSGQNCNSNLEATIDFTDDTSASVIVVDSTLPPPVVNSQHRSKNSSQIVNSSKCTNVTGTSFTKSPTMPVLMANACGKNCHHLQVNSNSNPNISASLSSNSSLASSSSCLGCCCEGSSNNHHRVISCKSSCPHSTQLLAGMQYPAHTLPIALAPHQMISQQQVEILRKRQYRVGLNLFNKKPERGIQFLIQNGFIDLNPCTGGNFNSSSASSSSGLSCSSSTSSSSHRNHHQAHQVHSTSSKGIHNGQHANGKSGSTDARFTGINDSNCNSCHKVQMNGQIASSKKYSSSSINSCCPSSTSDLAKSVTNSISCSTLSTTTESNQIEEKQFDENATSSDVTSTTTTTTVTTTTAVASSNNNSVNCNAAGTTNSNTNDYQDLLAASVAQFLLTRKGLSKEKIGSYLGNLRSPFNQRVLDFFVGNFNFTSVPVDEALRKFQATFRFPGESQQIERLIDKFAAHYVECNTDFSCKRKINTRIIPNAPDSLDAGSAGDSISSSSSTTHQSSSSSSCDLSYSVTSTSSSSTTSSSTSSASLIPEHFSSMSSSPSVGSQVKDEVFILSYAIIMLNTDLHTPNNKVRMTCDQWIKNLRGMFPGGDLADSYLTEIYDRIKLHELKTGPDHVTQVMKVQQQLVPGNKKNTSTLPNLPVPSRRLVCFCRLFEVPDVNKKEKPGQHLRDVFLFNDILLVTKVLYSSSKKILQTSNLPSMTSSNGQSNSSESKSNSSNSGNSSVYSYRGIYHLFGLCVKTFTTDAHPFGIRIIRKADEVDLLIFDAKSDYDRSRFVEDLRESIEEVDLMEAVESRSLQHLLYLHMRNNPHIGYHAHHLNNSIASVLASQNGPSPAIAPALNSVNSSSTSSAPFAHSNTPGNGESS